MKYAIRYYTKSGNTRKLAKAIEEVLGVKAKRVDTPLEEHVDILFLGSSVYAAGVDEEMKKFIRTLSPEKVGRVINFSTAALLPSTYKQVSKLLAEVNVPIAKEEFHCRGKFLSMHKNHPDETDLENLKKFVREVAHE